MGIWLNLLQKRTKVHFALEVKEYTDEIKQSLRLLVSVYKKYIFKYTDILSLVSLHHF